MKKWLVFLLCLSLLPSIAFAHPGGLDAAQGHRDAQNTSGLGSYHYHCEGREAHLHVWGLCPFGEEYEAYKEAKEEMQAILAEKEISPEQEERIRQLLCHEGFPFGLTREMLDGPDMRLAMTVKEKVSVRKKPLAKGSYAALAEEAGTPVLVTGAEIKGWYPVHYWHQGAVIQGYVQADELSEITLPEYAALLCDLL